MIDLTAERTVMERCRTEMGTGGGVITWRCSSTATALVTIGCLHEHVRTTWMCRAHQDGARIGENVCATCFNHPDSPHDCRLLLRPAQ